MFESTFWTIVKPSTLGPCWGGYFHFIPNKTQKKYRVQLIGVFLKNNLCIFGVYNSVSRFKKSFEVLAKIWREWPPHGSMKIKLNLLANGSICCVTCLALSWVSLKVFKYHKFQLNLWWHENCILNVIYPTQSMQSSTSKGSYCSTSWTISSWTSITYTTTYII